MDLCRPRRRPTHQQSCGAGDQGVRALEKAIIRDPKRTWQPLRRTPHDRGAHRSKAATPRPLLSHRLLPGLARRRHAPLVVRGRRRLSSCSITSRFWESTASGCAARHFARAPPSSAAPSACGARVPKRQAPVPAPPCLPPGGHRRLDTAFQPRFGSQWRSRVTRPKSMPSTSIASCVASSSARSSASG